MKLFSKLLKQDEISFPMPRKRLEATSELGVYLILNNRGSICHVGSTPRAKGGVAQRLRDHLYARSSFTNRYLGEDGDTLRGKYKYKYLAVKSPRARALLEAYCIGVLSPKHLGVGS